LDAEALQNLFSESGSSSMAALDRSLSSGQAPGPSSDLLHPPTLTSLGVYQTTSPKDAHPPSKDEDQLSGEKVPGPCSMKLQPDLRSPFLERRSNNKEKETDLRLKKESKEQTTVNKLLSGDVTTNSVSLLTVPSLSMSGLINAEITETGAISKTVRNDQYLVTLPSISEYQRLESQSSLPTALPESQNVHLPPQGESTNLLVLLLFYVNTIIVCVRRLLMRHQHVHGVPSRDVSNLSYAHISDPVLGDHINTIQRVNDDENDRPDAPSNDPGTPELTRNLNSEPYPSDSSLGSFEKPLPAYSSKVILDMQLKDTDLVIVKKWLIDKQKPGKDASRSAFSDDLNHYYHLFGHLTLSRDGSVCYKYFFKQSRKFRELLCVPKEARVNIMKSHHDSDHCGHFGPVKTLHRVREKYYFPCMSKEIKLYCNTCEVCFLNNPSYLRKPGAPLKLFTANRPGEYLSIDLIGPINGPCRFRYILTMKDRFTKFVQLAPLIDGTAQKIARALMDNWFFRFGIPEKILSDRAGNLTGDLMKSVYNLLQVNKVQTTSYHARGNGDCERSNKDVAIILKKLIQENYSSWPTKLTYVSFAINTAVHASTGFSPALLQFGRELRTPSDLWYDTTSTETYKSESHLAQASYLEMKNVYRLVRANLGKNQLLQKNFYDKKKGFHTTYKEGDLVMVWKPLSPSIKHFRKFRNCFSGPWFIKKVLSQWTYLVEHQLYPTKRQVVHFDTLRHIPGNLRSSNQSNSANAQVKANKECEDSSKELDQNDGLLPMIQMMFGTNTRPRLHISSEPPPDHNLVPQPEESEPVPNRPYDLRPRRRVKYSK
jgi:hypothetical protein